MASGVPVVSTRVGQVQELIESGVDGFLAPVGDVETLAEQLVAVAEGAAGHTFVASARARAESIAYEALDDLWEDFMDGFVACRAG